MASFEIRQFSDGARHPIFKERAQIGVLAPVPFYYLKNLQLMLSTIFSHCSDLRLEDELRFISEFPQCHSIRQALLARMAMRQGRLFRASNLNCAETADTRAVAALLIEVDSLPQTAVPLCELAKGGP